MGNTRVREGEVHTAWCKIGYRDELYNRGSVAISWNNCKWYVAFKTSKNKLKNQDKDGSTMRSLVNQLWHPEDEAGTWRNTCYGQGSGRELSWGLSPKGHVSLNMHPNTQDAQHQAWPLASPVASGWWCWVNMGPSVITKPSTEADFVFVFHNKVVF